MNGRIYLKLFAIPRCSSADLPIHNVRAGNFHGGGRGTGIDKGGGRGRGIQPSTQHIKVIHIGCAVGKRYSEGFETGATFSHKLVASRVTDGLWKPGDFI
jgi:hypothetical protein